MAATLGNGNITFGDSTTQSTAALPLTGGTLTGALSGTSISTTGNVTIGGALAANGGVTLGDASGDSLTINSGVANVPNTLVLAKDASSTAIAEQPLVLRRTSSGTPAAGIGVGMAFELETANNVVKTAGVLNAYSSSVTSGSESVNLAIGLLHQGSVRTTLINGSNGTLELYSAANITPNANYDANLKILGVGYTGGISLDGSSMYVGHNSSLRDLVLQTASTERMKITGSGNVHFGSYTPLTSTAKSVTLAADQNLSFVWGSGNRYANIYSQANTASLILANGLQYNSSANSYASSVDVSWARTALVVNGGEFKVVMAPTTTTAIGTAITPTDVMTIDVNGRVRMPKKPAFSVTGPYAGSAHVISVSAGNGYVVIWTGVYLNNGSHYNTSNGYFTAPVAGMYRFTASVSAAGNYSGPALYILQNGSLVGSHILAYNSYGYATCSMTWIFSLNAGDTIATYFIANNMDTAIDLTRSSFSGEMIG